MTSHLPPLCMIASPPAPSPVTYRDVRPGRDLLITLHEPDARVQNIPEAVIQDIWQCLRFTQAGLTTTAGEAVEIWHPGALNTDAGPDFTGARLHIGDLYWSGDIEVHRTSGEWIEHRHDEDPRYDRVALHVTLVPDRYTGRLRRSNGTVLPEIVLYPLLNDSLRSLLRRFYATPALDFFCAPHWPEVPESIRQHLMRTLGTERLTDRKTALAEAFLQTPDLDQLLYERVLRALGYSKNADAMETLARRVPLRRLRSLSDVRDAEALLLGTASLLPSPRDLLGADRDTADYAMDLRERFDRLHAGEPVARMCATVWKRARLRASSLPTRRIAQAAALVTRGGFLHHDPIGQLVRAAQSPNARRDLRALLTEATPSSFWKTHLRLDRACKPGRAQIGDRHAEAVLINAALPTLLLHAEQAGDTPLETLVHSLYEQFPAASDVITRQYEHHGTKPANALEAQGLHQLYRTRCQNGRCLSCTVGQHIVTGECVGREVGRIAAEA
jgi:hypothetical protein